MESVKETQNTKRIGIHTLLAVFVAGCIIGTVYEQVYVFAIYRVWVNKSGLIYGPVNPLYGFAVTAVVLLFGRVKSPVALYLGCALACGACEYFTHELEMLIFGTYSWNYIGKAGAIPSIVTLGATSGTTLPYILYWGVLGLIFVKGVFPLIKRIVDSIPNNCTRVLSSVMILFFVGNAFITGAALFRQTQRHGGIEPANAFWQAIDDHYTDEYLSKVYPTRPLPSNVE